MKMHMINLLMSGPSIILQDIIIRSAGSDGESLEDGKDFGKGVVGDVVEFCAVVFGDHEGVAGGEGVDVEEGEGFFGLEEFEGGDVA